MSPEPQTVKIAVYGNTLNIQAATKARTAYTVSIDAGLADGFGQVLEAPAKLTFQVTAAWPSFFVPGGTFAVLDPNAPPQLSVLTTGYERLDVKAYSVAPADFDRFQKAGADAERNIGPATWPVGRLALDTKVAVRGSKDDLVETVVALSAALKGKPGHLIVLIRPEPEGDGTRGREVARLWAQSTKIGLDAFADNEELVAWATSLTDGKPLSGARIALSPAGIEAMADANGLARLRLGEGSGRLLIATVGDDTALLPQSPSWWSEGDGWRRRDSGIGQRLFVFDDRHLYRPGEEVSLKGWIRSYGAGRGGDIGVAPAVKSITFTLRDSRGNEIAKGERPVGRLGGFDLSLKLPAAMNLGPAHLEFATAQGGGHHHGFDVQAFRRPEFEVKVTPSEGPHIVGGALHATVAASYFAGGALPDAEVRWDVHSAPGEFRPPNWDDYVFGRFIPWWRPRVFPVRDRPGHSISYPARTDGSGKHVLRVDLDSVTPPQPTVLTASATVIDVNRQAWSDQASLVVHPAKVYVGLRSPRTFVRQGEAMNYEVIVPDLDGKAVAGRPVAVRAERLEWEQIEDEWKEVVVSTETCELRSAAEPSRCTFRPKDGGSYRVTAIVRDEQDRPNETVTQFWVAGEEARPRRDVAQERVELIPQKKEFRSGETAEVLVVAPFAPAEGLLTLRRSGIVRTERFSTSSASHTLRIPIEEAFTPNVQVHVDLVGAAPKASVTSADARGNRRPAFASGELNLVVPPRERTLSVTAKPRQSALEPGGATTVDVELTDTAGRPVAGGEVAVVVVDEAVLALSGYQTPDPMGVFYAPRDPGVTDHHTRSHVVLAPEAAEAQITGAMGRGQEDALAGRVAAPAPAMAKEFAATAGQPAGPIRLRTDISALAVFAPSLTTDEAGRASVNVKLPDNLTRYRVMAVAAAGEKSFGSGESTLVARLPLMVRPSPPRFLNWGDRFDLPVVVQNQTDRPLEVEVAVRASNLDVPGGAGRRLRVEAHDRAEVGFPMETAGAGRARIQVAAASGAYADSAELTLPVWSPVTTEAFATYGQIDDGAIHQKVVSPSDVVPQFGGLEVTTSSTALQALTDAVLYLVSYRFDCTEQIASRVMGVAALRDVLSTFEAKGLPAPEELVAAGKRDLDRLAALQNDDGGFSFWRRGDRSWPFLGIHVAHALERAKAKGFEVPAHTLERSKQYLRRLETAIPSEYPPDIRRTLIAYGLHVRAISGDGDPARAHRLVQEAGVDKLSFEALGWLLGALGSDKDSAATAAAIRRHLGNRTTETASTAHFAVSYSDGAHLLLQSNRRADAVILESLIATEPANDLVPKLVAGLLNHRKAGRWENTQENVFVLLALDRYFGAYEKTTPDFVARMWLGDRYAGEQAFRGRATQRRSVEIPMSLLDAGGSDLIVNKEGAGRLYYRIGLRYAPKGLRLDPADHGFTVERTYQAVDDPGDVRRDADGTWRVRAGARVRVRLTMIAPARRYHVALVDPMPAGFEAENPGLATSAPVPNEPPAVGLFRGWSQPGPWFEHQSLRDERAEAFSSLLPEGVHSYTYVARATTPGSFVAPPPTAEEMYQPETFGRGPSSRVVIQ